jgi:acyl-CoA reductase-like NAD-dependent aldehyde dehydrogenase
MTAETVILPMRIGGREVQASDGSVLDAVDPATGRVLGRVPHATADDVDRAVTAAKAAFEDWRRTEPAQRSAALNELADRIADHATELAMLDVADNGSPGLRRGQDRSSGGKRQHGYHQAERAHVPVRATSRGPR